MEIVWFDVLDSTQKYLIKELREGKLQPPIAVAAVEQHSGVGSRENSWSGVKGNLFCSFALQIEKLPSDLPLASASIYFAYLMKQALGDAGEEVWIKWPNDIYRDEFKVGGIITQKIAGFFVCGIGVNVKKSMNEFKSLNSDICVKRLLLDYFHLIKKSPSWKEIFSLYQIEFDKSRSFFVHINTDKKSLKRATLCEDGSLEIEGERIYSSR